MSRAKSKKTNQRLAKKLIRWLTYNTLFALLPLGISILLRTLSGKLSIETLTNSPDILFFALMISSTTLGDMNEVADIIGWDTTFSILSSALTLGAVTSAILYGSFLYGDIANVDVVNFRSRLFWVSIGLSIVMYVLATLVEILIGKIENQ